MARGQTIGYGLRWNLWQRRFHSGHGWNIFSENSYRARRAKSNSLVAHIQKLLGKAAEHSSVKASKLALSLTIANLVISSRDFKQTHIKLVNSFSAWFVNGTTLYAKAQIAASAANRLKFQDPAYYQALYKENIEMLYFLIEPQMSEIIYQINSGDNNEEKIGDALYEILRKWSAFLWLIQSFFYLIPAVLIVAGIYIFVRFIPNYAAILSALWIVIVSIVYIKYNKWY